jgi:hypothetical protein
MISQNSNIISKLNTLINENKILGDQIASLEKNFSVDYDQDFLKVRFNELINISQHNVPVIIIILFTL